MCTYLPAAKLLEPLADACKSGPGVTLKIHVKVKGEDGSTQMGTMLDAMQAVEEPRVGLLSKDQHLGGFVALWERKLQDSGLATTDITIGGALGGFVGLCWAVWVSWGWGILGADWCGGDCEKKQQGDLHSLH
jgi:hypothetical protein